MKIAILRKKYTFHGGAEGFSQSIIRQLADAGHEVHIYAMKWDSNPTAKNIYFHKVPAITFNSTLRDLSFALSACRLLKREPFDIIQSHDKTLYQDIYRAGDGCHIEWLRQRWIRVGLWGKLSIIFNPYHWLILNLERLIFNAHRFKKIIAISELVKKNIIEHYNVNEEDIEVIYNGVDLERFNPENKDLYRKEIRKQYSIPDDTFVLLFVGSGFERKGVESLLKAIELVPNPLTLLIVGKGSERRYKGLIKKQRVIFCGPQKEIHKFYAASDIFVFPAIYEPFGNVHLEALASGLPVITTKLSGAAEIIKDGLHGFIVLFPEDYSAIAEKIKFLIENIKQRELISLNARKLAEEFSFETHLGKVLNLYKNI
ncbi:MAG: glycosyltransferase family 4 protein [Nitrospirota bacterium]